MAPEQARGQTVDKRADIRVSRAVLHEMLTGRRLFEGETISDMLVAVLKQEPEWEAFPRKRGRGCGAAWRRTQSGGGTTSEMLGGCRKRRHRNIKTTYLWDTTPEALRKAPGGVLPKRSTRVSVHVRFMNGQDLLAAALSLLKWESFRPGIGAWFRT